jgi:flagellar L-ring protein precursor FlgH
VFCAARNAGVLCALAFAAACSMMTPPTTVHQPMTARPAPRTDLNANAGGIYQADSARLVLYEDRRARFVGDTITIVIEEKTSASKKSSSDAAHNGSTSLNVPAVGGLLSGTPLARLQGVDLTATSATKFAGSGDAASNNLFTGNLAVTVIEVFSNGNFLVSGEKQVTINHGTEFIRFSGVVNPISITSTNTVSSTRVSDARIEYRGNGYVDEAQNMGWLSRAFMTVWPF